MKRIEVAIADVHGCYDELVELLSKVADECGDAEEVKLVMLGDLVDRGPASADVVELVRKMCERPFDYGFDVVAVTCGNHEDMMIRGCEDWHSFEHWIANGGVETIVSYGGLSKIPDSHIAFMEAMPAMLRTEHRYFVHAGLTPGVPVDKQPSVDCLWIREKFLHCPEPKWDRYIVHGHSPRHAHKQFDQAEILKWRANLDTGCFGSGILTAAIFDADVAGEPVKTLSTGVIQDAEIQEG